MFNKRLKSALPSLLLLLLATAIPYTVAEPLGGDCVDSTECDSGVQCSSDGICGGGGAGCSGSGSAPECVTSFCRSGTCSNAPGNTNPGNMCEEDNDCEGSTGFYGELVQCREGVCGGGTAFCYSQYPMKLASRVLLLTGLAHTGNTGENSGPSDVCASGKSTPWVGTGPSRPILICYS